MVLHAAAGCAAGAVATGNCTAGAIAEGLQELTGKPLEDLLGDSPRATAVVGLVAAIGAALSGAPATDISEAANIAETAHRFNYLAHRELERLRTAKAACASGNEAECAEAGRLEDKDRQQQQAYLACRANGYAGAGSLRCSATSPLPCRVSGIAPVYLRAADWQRIVGDRDTLDQLLEIMVPEGVDKLSAEDRRKLDFSIRVLTGDPTGITALPAVIKAAKDGSPFPAILQAVAIFTRIKGLANLGKLLGEDQGSGPEGRPADGDSGGGWCRDGGSRKKAAEKNHVGR